MDFVFVKPTSELSLLRQANDISFHFHGLNVPAMPTRPAVPVIRRSNKGGRIKTTSKPILPPSPTRQRSVVEEGINFVKEHVMLFSMSLQLAVDMTSSTSYPWLFYFLSVLLRLALSKQRYGRPFDISNLLASVTILNTLTMAILSLCKLLSFEDAHRLCTTSLLAGYASEHLRASWSAVLMIFMVAIWMNQNNAAFLVIIYLMTILGGLDGGRYKSLTK